MTPWRVLLLAVLVQPAAAAQPGVVRALVGNHVYAVPGYLLEDGVPAPDLDTRSGLDLRFLWPGMAPVPPGRHLGYNDGFVGALVQDLSPTTRVERLSELPGQRAKFLRLWEDSTVEQFNLPTPFSLQRLDTSDSPEAQRLGLRQLASMAAQADPDRTVRIFSDDAPDKLAVLMTCEDRLSCQLWWTQNEAAVEVTFDERFLPEWRLIRASVTTLLDGMARP